MHNPFPCAGGFRAEWVASPRHRRDHRGLQALKRYNCLLGHPGRHAPLLSLRLGRTCAQGVLSPAVRPREPRPAVACRPPRLRQECCRDHPLPRRVGRIGRQQNRRHQPNAQGGIGNNNRVDVLGLGALAARFSRAKGEKPGSQNAGKSRARVSRNSVRLGRLGIGEIRT